MNPICERCGATAKVMGIASFTLCRRCSKDASGAHLHADLRVARHWRLQRDEARLALMDCLRLLRVIGDMIDLAALTDEQREQLRIAITSTRNALAQMDTAPEARGERDGHRRNDEEG